MEARWPANEDRDALGERYARVRAASLALCEPLDAEDCVAQSMPDASPAKWHLAHTTWFFERFVLRERLDGYVPLDPSFDYLFNSYYDAVGPRHARPQRGLLTRPSLAAVREYRAHVDAAMAELFDAEAGAARTARARAAASAAVPLGEVLALGLAHEEQHQELIVTDVKHLLSCHPDWPAYRRAPARDASAARQGPPAPALRWHERPAGLVMIGAPADGFAFDNERPRHRVWLEAHAIASRPATNAEFLDFVRDGGYARPELWLSDGWATAQAQGWVRPLYWHEDLASEFTLAGRQPLDPVRPVCHLSYYEADAYARWSGARLPTEAEWEALAATAPVRGHFADAGDLHPRAAEEDALAQLYGDVWEWTASPYVAYPGFATAPGALGEYNGTFMCNQFVLRGGSCATPPGHVRASYRNFFPPHARWQFAGVRLAKDL